MNDEAVIGTSAPEIQVESWVQGGPWSIHVERDGILREVSFGFVDHLESIIMDCL